MKNRQSLKTLVPPVAVSTAALALGLSAARLDLASATVAGPRATLTSRALPFVSFPSAHLSCPED